MIMAGLGLKEERIAKKSEEMNQLELRRAAYSARFFVLFLVCAHMNSLTTITCIFLSIAISYTTYELRSMFIELLVNARDIHGDYVNSSPRH